MEVDKSTDAEPTTHSDELGLDTQAPRRSTRIRTPPVRYGFLIDEVNHVHLVEHDEPESYEEVLKSSESELRLKAMKSEMDSMEENQVWTLVDPPEGIKAYRVQMGFQKENRHGW